jgi:hypothetical protein
LAAFLLSLPFTGLKGLWESDIPATPMLLLSGAGAILLANAVIGDGREDRSPNAWLRRAALLLVVCVLPLAFFAALSMGQRIGQYGWTPERIWGVVAVGIALAYGAAAWWAVFKGRQEFDEPLRPLQTKLAIGLCGLALFLALPILDFGAISANSQLSRLHDGRVTAEEFDWTAMAFDFGKAGRERLAEIAKSGEAQQRQLAATALQTKDRWALARETQIVERQADIEKRVRLLSPDIQWSDDLRRKVSEQNECEDQSKCALVRLSPDKLLFLRTYGPDNYLTASVLDLAAQPSKTPTGDGRVAILVDPMDATDIRGVDLGSAKVEVRESTVRQAYVNGKPVGQAVRISR